MTRIGFSYNQKPDASIESERETASSDSSDGFDVEPPSFSPTAGTRGALAVATKRVSGDTTDDMYAEWDSPATIAAVERALAGLGDVVRIEANAEFPQRLRESRVDIVFNMAEGLVGPNREAHVPAICEFYGVPYSGSDPFTLSLALHKARTKQLLQFYRIPTAPFALVESVLEAKAVRRAKLLRYPLFAKPVQEGSSKGITEKNYIRDGDELLTAVEALLDAYKQPVLLEEFLPGAEFTCGVIGNGKEARVLPIVGIRFDVLPDGALPIYGFEAKWIWDRPDEPLDMFECPARVDATLRSAIEDVTLRAYNAIGCRDWSRIDVRLDAHGVPNIVEINPLPGILPNPEDNSCLPKAAAAAGIGYDELIQSCLLAAAKRQGIRIGRARRGAKR